MRWPLVPVRSSSLPTVSFSTLDVVKGGHLIHRAGTRADHAAALSNSCRATSKSSARSHTSGTSSQHELIPTSSLPVSDITVMLRPVPWKIGPSGYIALTWQPRKYNGTCGPDTLEMTRLCTGRRVSTVLAKSPTAG